MSVGTLMGGGRGRKEEKGRKNMKHKNVARSLREQGYLWEKGGDL